MATPTAHSGQVLGRYLLLEQIGAGGMGVVFKARDQRLSRDVAIKLLAPGSIRSVVARHRVRNEAMALSRLSHPNIETIFEFDTLDDRDFLVVELIPGISVDELIAKGPIPQTLIVSLAVQLLRGLTAAHEKGIIHRDLKPSNLRLTSDSFLKILDFGIAHVANETQETHTLTTETHNNIFSGTLSYMSPEQLRGTPMDPRSDLYSVGLVLYQMCAGRLPFTESGAVLIDAILNRPVPPLSKLNPAVSPKLEAVILEALQKDPRLRYQSAREMLADLEELDLRGRAHSRKLPIAVAAALAVILISNFAMVESSSLRRLAKQALGMQRQRPIGSLAVLPLADLSGDSPQAYFADGLTDMLITDLGKIRALRVISRTSVMQYKGSPKPMKQIANDLGVDAVIEGSILRSGSQVQITARLIQARTDSQIWSRVYEQELGKLPELQSALAQAIADEISVKLTPEEHARIAATHVVSPEAFDAYLRGRYYWDKRTEEGLKKSLEYFQQAIDYDPNYALAYSGLADSYSTLGNNQFLPPDETFPKAREAARRALIVDDNLAEAHASLAFARWNYGFDWQDVEREYKRAIELNPGYATAYHWYSGFLSGMGRHEEAIAAINKARELDPLSPRINANVGIILYFAGDYDKAIKELQKSKEMDPKSGATDLYLGMAYVAKGEYEQAISALERNSSVPDAAPSSLLDLAFGYAKANQGARARRIIDETLQRSHQSYVPALWIARVYAALGEKDNAFKWLDSAYSEHSPQLAFLNVDPTLESLRSDPRFLTLLSKMGLSFGGRS